MLSTFCLVNHMASNQQCQLIFFQYVCFCCLLTCFGLENFGKGSYWLRKIKQKKGKKTNSLNSEVTFKVELLFSTWRKKNIDRTRISNGVCQFLFFFTELRYRYNPFLLFAGFLCSHSTDFGISHYRPSHHPLVGRERSLESESRDFLLGVFLLADIHRLVAHGCRKSRMLAKFCEVLNFPINLTASQMQ